MSVDFTAFLLPSFSCWAGGAAFLPFSHPCHMRRWQQSLLFLNSFNYSLCSGAVNSLYSTKIINPWQFVGVTLAKMYIKKQHQDVLMLLIFTWIGKILLTDFKSLNNGAVSLDILSLKVVELTTTFADQCLKSALCCIIFVI